MEERQQVSLVCIRLWFGRLCRHVIFRLLFSFFCSCSHESKIFHKSCLYFCSLANSMFGVDDAFRVVLDDFGDLNLLNKSF